MDGAFLKSSFNGCYGLKNDVFTELRIPSVERHYCLAQVASVDSGTINSLNNESSMSQSASLLFRAGARP